MTKKKLEQNYGEVLWYGKRCRLGLPLSFTRYILTANKLYVKTGFLNVKEERVELYRIVDFTLSLPLGERMCGCGTIKVYAKDKTMPEQDLKSVRHPRKALNLLEEAVEKERVKYKIHGRDMTGSLGVNITEGHDIEDTDAHE